MKRLKLSTTVYRRSSQRGYTCGLSLYICTDKGSPGGFTTIVCTKRRLANQLFTSDKNKRKEYNTYSNRSKKVYKFSLNIKKKTFDRQVFEIDKRIEKNKKRIDKDLRELYSTIPNLHRRVQVHNLQIRDYIVTTPPLKILH